MTGDNEIWLHFAVVTPLKLDARRRS